MVEITMRIYKEHENEVHSGVKMASSDGKYICKFKYYDTQSRIVSKYT